MAGRVGHVPLGSLGSRLGHARDAERVREENWIQGPIRVGGEPSSCLICVSLYYRLQACVARRRSEGLVPRHGGLVRVSNLSLLYGDDLLRERVRATGTRNHLGVRCDAMR
jgi:hypothetical protein